MGRFILVILLTVALRAGAWQAHAWGDWIYWHPMGGDVAVLVGVAHRLEELCQGFGRGAAVHLLGHAGSPSVPSSRMRSRTLLMTWARTT